MNTSERFTFEPTDEGWRSTRIARGELSDQRFQLPTGVTDVIFDRARLVSVDFTETRFPCFIAYGSEFDGCDFSGACFEQLLMGSTGIGGQEWDGATWPQTVFRNCTFRRTRFAERTFFGNVRFERCVFDRSRLREQTATFEAEFVDCVFLGRVRNMNFWGRPADRDQAVLGRGHNDFTGNDFTAADPTTMGSCATRSSLFLPGVVLETAGLKLTGSHLIIVIGWDLVVSGFMNQVRPDLRAAEQVSGKAQVASGHWWRSEFASPGMAMPLWARCCDKVI